MSVADSFPMALSGLRRLLRDHACYAPGLRSGLVLPLPPLSRRFLLAAALMALAVLLVRDDRSAAVQAAAPPAPPALATSCETLPATITVANRHPDTQCRQVSGAGIGVAALVDGGASEAVDLWNVVAPGTKVCFAATGDSIQFLDAAGTPRQPSELTANSEGDMFCATIDRPGTVVLMPGPLAVNSVPAAAAAPVKRRTARARKEAGKGTRVQAANARPERDSATRSVTGSLSDSSDRPVDVVHYVDFINCNMQWPCPD